ncbi:MAG: DUF4870 domain-containing protein [Phycisphaerales bacterium]|nr:MAG: DUF4870 domain-containing protein [Phycisphaerales bacterium]
MSDERLRNEEAPPQGEPGHPGGADFFSPTSEEKTMAMLCHLAALCQLVGVPFGGILGPLVVWLIKKDQSPFVDDQGKEALNFQITVLIAIVCCIPLIFILIGILLLIIIAIGQLVLLIIAAVNAASGTPYRYPMTFRFIK